MSAQHNDQTTDNSPFHRGEQALQARAGKREEIETFGRRMIRDYLPEQHRSFYRQLPLLLVGSVDNDGWPWASALAGEPGFISSPDEHHLQINALPLAGDPLAENLQRGAALGMLGIEFASRRRNRLNGDVAAINPSGFNVAVRQAFGNCPQYIQTRSFAFQRDPLEALSATPEHFQQFDQAAQDLIAAADTFFVASFARQENNAAGDGVDISHRGGLPGFVKMDHNTLSIPDYRGNFHFNTLGNFLLNPTAGLLFIDFASGDVLQLTGAVEIVWEGAEVSDFPGAQRIWRFTLDHGRRLRGALPLRWQFGEYSPQTLQVGGQPEAINNE